MITFRNLFYLEPYETDKIELKLVVNSNPIFVIDNIQAQNFPYTSPLFYMK